MRIYNKYILSLVLASYIINTLLAGFGQNNLVNYFLINILAYLVITLLYVHLNPRARRALNTVSAVFLASVIVISVLKAMETLAS